MKRAHDKVNIPNQKGIPLRKPNEMARQHPMDFAQAPTFTELVETPEIQKVKEKLSRSDSLLEWSMGSIGPSNILSLLISFPIANKHKSYLKSFRQMPEVFSNMLTIVISITPVGAGRVRHCGKNG